MDRLDYILYELPIGFAVFKVSRQVDGLSSAVGQTLEDLALFSRLVQKVHFLAWESVPNVYDHLELISKGGLPENVIKIIDLCFPEITTGKAKNRIFLGVADKALGAALKAKYPGFACPTPDTSPLAFKLFRGIRTHCVKLIGGIQKEDLATFALVAGSQYSRSRLRYSTARNDKLIMAAISTLDTVDKTVNTLGMRLRDMYGAHFPELVHYVSDNTAYPKLVIAIKDKNALTQESFRQLAPLLDNDEERAKVIVNAATYSLGGDISQIDQDKLIECATDLADQMSTRQYVVQYLESSLHNTAPNLQALIGTALGAKLIQKAGSLKELAKKPASTLQILGAEKALFRALKTKSNTPKYGLLFNSGFVSRASQKHKGRIARYLSNKCSLASRMDAFTEGGGAERTSYFGDAFRQQVEARLNFLANGVKAPKNSDIILKTMQLVLDDQGLDDGVAVTSKPLVENRKKKTKEKKDKTESKSVKAAIPDRDKSKGQAKSQKRDREIAEHDPEPKAKKSKKTASSLT